ncbi:MAG: uracil-DNA glycosylase [Gammaproteobacteria bacterium]
MTHPPDILKELGLLPQWRLCAPAADTAAEGKSAKVAPAAEVAKVASGDAKAKPAADVIAKKPAAVVGEKPPVVIAANIAKMDWAALYQTVHSCVKCELCQKRKQPVFGIGDTEADIMFVGEGPGAEEDRQGEPFVGAAGKLLDRMLSAIGLSRESGVYIANVVKCRPPQNRTPKNTEAAACLPYLHRQIELVKPKLLVALGRVAAAHLGADAPIAQTRQSMHEYRGIRLVVSYHPAYLLRTPADKRKSWDDLRLIKKLAAS